MAGNAAIDEIFDSPYQNAPRIALGGAVCYSSICLASLGYDTVTVAKVGIDFPKENITLLKKLAGVDVETWKSKQRKTTRFRIIREGDKRELYLLQKCDDLTMEDFKEYLRDGSTKRPRFLIMNSIAGEIGPRIVKRLTENGAKVFVDSQSFTRRFDKKTGRVNMTSGIDLNFLKGVVGLKADRAELRAMTGMNEKIESIKLLSKFVDNIILTSGSRDAELYQDGDQKFSARTLPVKCVDTSGARDIMLASFAAPFSESSDLKTSLEFATAASSLSTKTVGIRKAILLRDFVEGNIRSAGIQDSSLRVSAYRRG